jgi:hypothetical protein
MARLTNAQLADNFLKLLNSKGGFYGVAEWVQNLLDNGFTEDEAQEASWNVYRKLGSINRNHLKQFAQKELDKVKKPKSDKLSEVYYNKEWTITNIIKWIKEYATNKNLELKALDKKTEPDRYGSKRTFYSFSLGNKKVIVYSDPSPGAPRLNEIYIFLGDVDPANKWNLKNFIKLTSQDSDSSIVFREFDKKFGTTNEDLNEDDKQVRDAEIKSSQEDIKAKEVALKNAKEKLAKLKASSIAEFSLAKHYSSLLEAAEDKPEDKPEDAPADDAPEDAPAQSEEPNVKFNMAKVKKYNQYPVIDNTGILMGATKTGVSVKVGDNIIVVNYEDILD